MQAVASFWAACCASRGLDYLVTAPAVDAKHVGIEGVSRFGKAALVPPVKEGLQDGQLAWRQHDNGNTDLPNVKYFIKKADTFIGHAPPQRQFPL